MDLQKKCIRERFFAERAVKHVSSVYTSVVVEIDFLVEGFAAQITGIRPVTCVGSHVKLQVPPLTERFPTNRTDKRFLA